MELKTCPNGHTFDPSISAKCPICGCEASSGFGMSTAPDIGHTIPLTYDDSGILGGAGSTVPMQNWGATEPISQPQWGTTEPAQQWNPTEPVNNFGGWADPGATVPAGGTSGQGGYTPKNENGIWNLTGSRLYKAIFPPIAFLEGLKIRRIKRQMLHAAKKGLTFHLWWHPHNVGVRTELHMQQLEEIMKYYDKMKATYGMRSLNMDEAAREVWNG